MDSWANHSRERSAYIPSPLWNQVRFVHVDHLKSTACEPSGPVADMSAPLKELPSMDESVFRGPMTSGSTIVLESPISASTPASVAESTGTEKVKDCSVPKGGSSSTVEPNPEESTTPNLPELACQQPRYPQRERRTPKRLTLYL